MTLKGSFYVFDKKGIVGPGRGHESAAIGLRSRQLTCTEFPRTGGTRDYVQQVPGNLRQRAE